MLNEFHRIAILPQPDISSHEALTRIKKCASALSAHFSTKHDLLLDGDGVLVDQDSLFHPTLIDPSIIPTLRLLEKQVINIGVATARSESFIDFLRANGLIIAGPQILQEGQVLYKDEQKVYFVSEAYKNFVRAVDRIIPKLSNWRTRWADVWSSDEPVFCNGNSQWQGDCRISFWFYEKNGIVHGEKIKQRLDPIIEEVAKSFELRSGRDYIFSLSRMSLERYSRNGDLGIMSLKAIREGLPFDKSVAASYLGMPFVLVADGYHDAVLGYINKAHGGLNIGVEGNLDKSNDASNYMKLTDIRLGSVHEFTEAVRMVVQ